VRGTNQTGELCGCINALLWIEEYGEDGDIAICVDSLYAGNEIEGCWAVKANHHQIRSGGAFKSALGEECDVYTREGTLGKRGERKSERAGPVGEV
jgi:ribonuclease HI